MFFFLIEEKKAALSQGAVLFYFRVNEFKCLVGDSQAVIDSTALNIWTNFMSSKADHQVGRAKGDLYNNSLIASWKGYDFVRCLSKNQVLER